MLFSFKESISFSKQMALKAAPCDAPACSVCRWTCSDFADLLTLPHKWQVQEQRGVPWVGIIRCCCCGCPPNASENDGRSASPVNPTGKSSSCGPSGSLNRPPFQSSFGDPPAFPRLVVPLIRLAQSNL